MLAHQPGVGHHEATRSERSLRKPEMDPEMATDCSARRIRIRTPVSATKWSEGIGSRWSATIPYKFSLAPSI
eukprot:3286268-Rhodomonas_salina.2